MSNTISPLFNNIFVISSDEYEEVLSVKKNPDPDLEFDFDPLAFALASFSGNNMSSIHDYLTTPSLRPPPAHKQLVEKSKEFEEQAETIRHYYRNKMMLRRLKGLQLSKYGAVIEKITENPRQMPKSYVSALLKMKDFYEEDTTTDALLREHVSLNYAKSFYLDDVFEHVKTIHRSTRRDKIIKYYFANKQKHLVQIPIYERGINAKLAANMMNYIIDQKKPIHIKGICQSNYQLWHEDFYMYMNGDFQFNEPNG